MSEAVFLRFVFEAIVKPPTPSVKAGRHRSWGCLFHRWSFNVKCLFYNNYTLLYSCWSFKSHYEASGYDDKISIRFREPGIYQITIDKFVVPQEAVVEEIEFKLNKLHKGELGEDIYLKTLFIADRPEVTIKNFRIKVPDSQNKVIDSRELTKQGLINYFTPILNFEPE